MKTIKPQQGESLEDLARRVYVVSGVDGHESPDRLKRAVVAIRDANPHLDDETSEIRLPEIERIPYLKDVIEDHQQLHRVVHRYLEEVNRDPMLCMLSFIDPLRLSCEELGVMVTPQVADIVRHILEGKVSFNQEHYDRVRDGRETLDGVVNIQWTPDEERSSAPPTPTASETPRRKGGTR